MALLKSKGNVLIIIILAIAALVALSAGVYKILPKKGGLASKPAEESPTPSIQVQEKEEVVPTIVPIKDNTLDILLMGIGGAGHEGGTLSDSITLVRLDAANKKVTLIAIPRDLWVPIPAGGNNSVWQKINMAYAQGGGNLSEYVVSQTLAVQVDRYITVDFGNFTGGVNELGGVDVDVAKTFDDYFYPMAGQELNTCGATPDQIAAWEKQYSGFSLEKQFTCRYEHIHFDKGITHMDGATTLKFVRSRHSAEYGSDFARGERAQAVLLAIAKKLLDQGMLDPNNATFKKLIRIVKSDIALKDVAGILKSLGELKNYQIKHLYLTDQNVLTSATSSSGAFILIPKAGSGNFDELRKFIQN